MPNPYFQFKQFTVRQDNCAMKVCSDACLFGAWVAEKIRSMESMDTTPDAPVAVNQILDIGAGTGLLTLMLAQKLNARIDAIEIDEQAFLQASDNVANSPWHHRIQAMQGDVRLYHFDRKYDMIVSNPPFFQHDLRAANRRINQAKHDEGLTIAALATAVEANLAAAGSFFMLLPFSRAAYGIRMMAQAGFTLHSTINLKQSPAHACFRCFLHFSKIASQETTEMEWTLKEENMYSGACAVLLKDYYLYL